MDVYFVWLLWLTTGVVGGHLIYLRQWGKALLRILVTGATVGLAVFGSTYVGGPRRRGGERGGGVGDGQAGPVSAPSHMMTSTSTGRAAVVGVVIVLSLAPLPRLLTSPSSCPTKSTTKQI